MIREVQASIVWCIPNFRRLASKVTSPAFGPAKCQWEIALYPDGQGATRGTHIGIFLDVVKSDHELRLADAYSRPILSFRISVLRKGVSDDILAAKERDPFNADGFGAGFMHPKSWGWAAFLPVAKLDEALTPSGAIVVQAEVVWHAPAEVSAFLDRLSANAAATAVSNERLLFSDVMSDVVFLAPDFVVDSYGGEFGAAGTNEESCDVEGEEDADRSSLVHHGRDEATAGASEATADQILQQVAEHRQPRLAEDTRPTSASHISESGVGPPVWRPQLSLPRHRPPFSSSQRTRTDCSLPPANALSEIPPSAPPTPTRREPRVVAIPAHRAILASRSDYYLAMFTSGLIESLRSVPALAPPAPLTPMLTQPLLPPASSLVEASTLSSSSQSTSVTLLESPTSTLSSPSCTAPLHPFPWTSQQRSPQTPLTTLMDPMPQASRPSVNLPQPSPSRSWAGGTSISDHWVPGTWRGREVGGGGFAKGVGGVGGGASAGGGAGEGAVPKRMESVGAPREPQTTSLSSSSTGPSGPAVVRVTDFSAASIRWMLEFLYTGGIRHKPTTRAQRYELLRLADRYQLGGLHDHIASLICDADLTLETMTEILELGDRYGSASPALRTACLGFIRDNAAKLKASESFKAWVRSTDRRDLLLELFTLL